MQTRRKMNHRKLRKHNLKEEATSMITTKSMAASPGLVSMTTLKIYGLKKVNVHTLSQVTKKRTLMKLCNNVKRRKNQRLVSTSYKSQSNSKMHKEKQCLGEKRAMRTG